MRRRSLFHVGASEIPGAWDVTTASYLQNFSVSSQDTSPTGLFFKPDGSKMYVLGNAGNDVNEYDLSTSWNISTASYLQNFSVSSQETTPTGIFFKPDGSKMYVIGSAGSKYVNEYDLSTAWDISTASYLQNFSVSSQDTAPSGIFFKPDGSKMYVAGDAGNDVNEYDLSTAWNVTTASYLQNFSVSSQETFLQDVFFKPDGSKMYVIGWTAAVHEYDLSTSWNISTASYLQEFSVSSQDSTPSGIFFKPDGSKMYVAGDAGNDVNEYDLGT